MRLAAVVIAVGLALAASFAAPAVRAADDPARAARLDQLFRDLKAATSQAEGAAIEDQIVGIWQQSGDPQIDELLGLAVRAMDRRSYEVALTHLNAIIAAKPGFAEGWNTRATLYYGIGRYPESLADIAETLKLEPRHFGAIAGRGMVMIELGEPQKAIDAFKEVLAIDPQLSHIREAVSVLEDLLKRKSI
jgi:tetratricopeptide (TPR) repeat protein